MNVDVVDCVADAEGIRSLCTQMTQSEVLAYLLLANNCLRDEEVVLIGEVLAAYVACTCIVS